MRLRGRQLLWLGAAVLVVAALGTAFWIRRFRDYTPAEAYADVRAALAARHEPQPVQRFLALRYGPMSDPANRQRAFLDFFDVAHIEGLYLIVTHMTPGEKQTNINAMADWVANYRETMSPAEREALGWQVRSEAGRARLRQATARYLEKDVRFRAETAGVIEELMATLAATPPE